MCNLWYPDRKLSTVLLIVSTFVVLSSSITIRDDRLLIIPGCQPETSKCINRTNIRCANTKYRTLDGSCNNPLHPALGIAYDPYARSGPPTYSDGLYKLRKATDGSDLPSARLLSYKVFGRERIPDPHYTWINMQWGQIITHDLSLRVPDKFPGVKQREPSLQKCCSRKGRYDWETTTTPCEPILVPRHDPFFTKWQCIFFDRSITEKDLQCPGTENVPAEQLNGVTHYLDLNMVYGNSEAESRRLRSLQGGLLRTQDELGEFPPHTDANGTEVFCFRSSNEDICYEVGDLRGNQNTGLTLLQIVLLREHNRIAKELSRLNRRWDDATLFQEARRILIAEYQHITFYEWALDFFGKDRLKANRVIYDTTGGEFVNDYNACTDPRTLQEFAHGSFRDFHVQVFGLIKMFTESREEYDQIIRLSKFQNRPGFIESQCKYDSLIRGMATEPQKDTDHNIDTEIAEHFTLGVDLRGRDVRAFDIQRERDHGLLTYNSLREFCGLQRATAWQDFADYISNEDINLLQELYKHPDDVDLTVGGALEGHLPNSLTGPTFACLDIIEFYRTRVGDRYFFENAVNPHPFTAEQLAEIRKATVSRLLCDNADIENIQPKGFRLISRRNKLTECKKLQKINLSKWKTDDC